jgi:hypothetical protein
MPRSPLHPTLLDLPDEPDPNRIPIRYGDRHQLAEIHHRYFGPLSARSLEVWPLPWRRVNGRAVTDVRAFLAEAERRFNDAPVVMGGRRSPSQKAA